MKEIIQAKHQVNKSEENAAINVEVFISSLYQYNRLLV
jgi:hypothetical protein